MADTSPAYPFMTWGHASPVAALELRERLHVAPEMVPDVQGRVLDLPQVLGCCLLSTCNRTEFFLALAPDASPRDVAASLAEATRDRCGLEAAGFAAAVTSKAGPAALGRMAAIASGIESQVLGETQILGQFRAAAAAAVAAGHAGGGLDEALRMALGTARSVRAGTGLGERPVSIASVAVRCCAQVYSPPYGRLRVLLVGAGEIGTLVARHLQERGVADFAVAGRSLDREHPFPVGERWHVSELPGRLQSYDLVVCSTGSRQPLVRAQDAAQALRRRRQPMVFLDLAVPRDVDRGVDGLRDAFVFDLDHLGQESGAGFDARRREAERARQMIRSEVAAFGGRLRARHVSRLVAGLRELSREEADALLDAAVLEDAASEGALRKLAQRLEGRLSHLMTEAVRQALQLRDELDAGDGGAAPDRDPDALGLRLLERVRAQLRSRAGSSRKPAPQSGTRRAGGARG